MDSLAVPGGLAILTIIVEIVMLIVAVIIEWATRPARSWLSSKVVGWRKAHTPVFISSFNNGVWAVAPQSDRKRYGALPFVPGVFSSLVLYPRTMVFTDHRTTWRTGTISDMEKLLKDCEVRQLISVFVPFSSGLWGGFEKQAERCKLISLQEAEELIREERTISRREAGFLRLRATFAKS
jgi:hypothetical protein